MRIAIGGLSHETNTFCSALTEVNEFKDRSGPMETHFRAGASRARSGRWTSGRGVNHDASRRL